MGPNITQLAYSLLMSNPQIANSPQGQQFMQILQSGDQKAGEQMAMNICNSYGTTPQNALMMALKFFQGR